MAVGALIDHEFLAGHDQQGKLSRVGDHLGVPPLSQQQPERLEVGVAHADGRPDRGAGALHAKGAAGIA